MQKSMQAKNVVRAEKDFPRSIRLSPEELTLIEAAAAQAGITRHAWMRKTLLHIANREVYRH